MSSVALHGLRGGVGATSAAAALAYAMHSLGQRVVALDLSAQDLLRLHFNVSWADARGWASAAAAGRPWHADAYTVLPGLHLLPHGSPPDTADPAPDPATWRARLGELSAHYDWVVLDLPAGPQGAALLGLADLDLCLAEADPACAALLARRSAREAPHLLISRYDPASPLQRDIRLVWQHEYERLVPSVLHRDESVLEALAHKMPVGQYRLGSQGAQDALSLAAWCQARAGRPAP
ncbi:cellulose biosynthesis protein BcsQ [Bordetella sp. 2513F-2]